jgi:putative ABC transport system substrate-binding protein
MTRDKPPERPGINAATDSIAPAPAAQRRCVSWPRRLMGGKLSPGGPQMSNSTHGTGCWTNALLRAAALGSALLVAMPVARTVAQTVPVLGYVANENADPKRMAALKKGLTDLGYIEGQTLKIEYRYAKLDHEYDAVMAELLSRKVTIILAGNAPAAAAAARATRTVPVVLGAVNDPVGLGVADSLERPGRNVTGTTIYAPHLIGERLRILKAIIPALDRVAILVNGNNKNNPAQVTLLTAAANDLGIEVQPMDIRTPADVEPAVARAMSWGAKGFLNGVDSFINSQRFALAKLASRNKVPTIYTDREYVLAGGLISLGVGHLDGYYRAAGYVDKILRGANPAELPIALPTELIFSVNRSALKDIGLTLPKEIADRVTEWLP